MPSGLGSNANRLSVMLWKDGKAKRIAVHILVAITWVGPKPSPLHEVAHKDGVSWHNHADNLEWKTHPENIKDKIHHGTHGMKLTEEQVCHIKDSYVPRKNGKRLADEFGISLTHLTAIASGRVWRHV